MKRRNIIYGVVCALFCFICLSCSDENENTFASTETGLILQINAGQKTFTRADGTSAESAWDNVIRSLDVFIFDSETGNLVPDCYFHFGNGSSNIVDPVCLIPGNWKTRFQDYKTCDVYVVANLHSYSLDNNTESEINLEEDIKKLNDLKLLIDEYQNIYQPVSQDSKIPFTMSGSYIQWEPAESSNVYTIPVELTRLAAKIEISLNLDFGKKTTTIDGVDYYLPTNNDIGLLQYSVHNYATNARVLPGNDDTFEYTIASAAEAGIKFMDTDGSGNSVPKIIAYTYPTEWSDDILKETYVILNAQLKSVYPINGAYQYMDNYYKIPIRLSTDENKKLERNHWYIIEANISAKGNATPDKPVTLTDVKYKVAPWNDIDIDINGDTPMYLELSEYDVVMRNVDTYDLTFASSSQIEKNVSSQNAEIEIKEIYYKNKYGKKIDLTDNNEIMNKTYLSVEGGLNGHLVIHSPIPENKTIRYITLTVKNAQYDESNSGTHSCIKTVTIKQYPLEYITGIAGLCSYLENNDHYKVDWPKYNSQWIRYLNYYTTGETPQYTFNDNIPLNIITYLDGKIGEKFKEGEDTRSVDMKCKFYVENESGEGRIFRIDQFYFPDNSSNNLSNYVTDNGTASNNQMYHVVITSTSENYQLGRPIMDEEDTEIVDPENLDNDKLVSPSFMLASQLGNSSTIKWADARDQCKNYVEVGINGKVYDDWRLPTAAEINIIIKYQTDDKVNTGDNKAVMDYVLNYGDQEIPNYWISRYNYSMQIPESGEGTLNKGKDDLESYRRVRCVRDFHVGEPTE